MRTNSVHKYLTIFVRIVLGFLFLYACLDKITNPAKFAEVIYNYRILPIEFLNICAIILPWVEAFIGVTLLMGIWIDVSVIYLNVITLFFIIMIITAIARGLNIECGCFSLDEAGSLVSWKRVIEDVFILAGGIYLFLINDKFEPGYNGIE